MILVIQILKGSTHIQRFGLSDFFIYKALEAKRLPENSERNNDIKPTLSHGLVEILAPFMTLIRAQTWKLVFEELCSKSWKVITM